MLEDLLREKKKEIVKRWYQEVLATYPEETAAFLKKNRDNFENPVGQRIVEGIEGLLEELIQESGQERIKYFVDRVVRIRAVQDFPPSVAVNLFVLLKKIIKSMIVQEGKGELLRDYLSLEEKIDQMAMYAFDIYMACRERLYHLKVEEWKKKLFLLLRRSNMIYDEREGSLLPQQQ